jgi:hypothetical protein
MHRVRCVLTSILSPALLVGPLGAIGAAPLLAQQAAGSAEVAVPLARSQLLASVPTGAPNAFYDVIGDVNLDGRADLVVSHYSVGSATVLLGDGDGGFGAPTYHFSPSSVTDIELGDLDGDGLLDLVVCNESGGPQSATIGTRLGNGTSNFGAQAFHPTGHLPYSLCLADFDLDGRLDVACSDIAGDAHGAVLLGVGDGTLGPSIALPTPGESFDIAAADLDQNGVPDLVTAEGVGKTVAVMHHLGAGSFALVQTLLADEQVWMLALGDMNGDGLPDLATQAYSKVRLYAGSPAGTFTPLAPIPKGAGVGPMRAVDYDADSDLDLIWIQNSFPGFLVHVPGNGHGAFPPAQGFSYSVAGTAHGLAVGDVDSDGRLDSIVVYGTSTFAPADVFLGDPALPGNLIPFASGTPGCNGILGIGAKGNAQVGNAAFALTCTNAPPLAQGFAMLGTASHYQGTDPFQLGVKLHVDPLASSAWVLLGLASDESGVGHRALPIPVQAGLAGLQLFAQFAWIEPLLQSCSASPFPLVTSNALGIAILP